MIAAPAGSSAAAAVPCGPQPRFRGVLPVCRGAGAQGRIGIDALCSSVPSRIVSDDRTRNTKARSPTGSRASPIPAPSWRGAGRSLLPLAVVTALVFAVGLWFALLQLARRLPDGRHRAHHVHPRAQRLAQPVRLRRDVRRRARHAGLAPSAGRRRRRRPPPRSAPSSPRWRCSPARSGAGRPGARSGNGTGA